VLKIVGCWIPGLSLCGRDVGLSNDNLPGYKYFSQLQSVDCEASGCCSGEGHNVIHGSGDVEFKDQAKRFSSPLQHPSCMTCAI
jgi:hypothetical protein